jgi:hypothetical protein
MKQIDTKYIRADKTIEKYISNNGILVFIYNNQGLYFDVFFSTQRMNDFVHNKVDRGDIFFDNEELLNKYLGFN